MEMIIDWDFSFFEYFLQRCQLFDLQVSGSFFFFKRKMCYYYFLISSGAL